MSTDTVEEQLVKYLTDVHSIEQQALAQMKVAPSMAGDEQIASVFSDHLTETEGHERLVTERLQAHGAKPSKVKDLAGTLTGAGFAAFAKTQPDTPGKLVVHAFSYEHMEEAAYDLLSRVALRAGDAGTADVARLIEDQEHAMGDRLAGCFDRAVSASLRDLPTTSVISSTSTSPTLTRSRPRRWCCWARAPLSRAQISWRQRTPATGRRPRSTSGSSPRGSMRAAPPPPGSRTRR
jgi:ferritin-like metal-binding protein YciE